MPPEKYKSSQYTKNKIMKTAISVFNEYGSASISLNMLAAEIGISTGNLQYHYQNKEEIIRAILEIMFNDWNTVYQEMHVPTFSLDSLRTVLEINFKLVWKYRFFYRELNALLLKDELLAKRFAIIQEQRLTEQEMLMKQINRSKQARSVKKSELRSIVTIGWIISNSWLSYIESTGKPIDEHAMKAGVDILVDHYKPYL